jgi:hypothetical protein
MSGDVIQYLQEAAKSTPFSLERERLDIAITEIKRLKLELNKLQHVNDINNRTT